MADIYIKFGDKIKGESTDKDHDKWCELSSFATGCMQPVSQASGTGGRTSSGVSWQDFSMSKDVDNSSADIMMACCQGEHIPKIDVHIVQSAGETRHQFVKYELENVIISSYSISGSGGGGKPMEQISLNAGKVQMAYTPIDHTGKAGTEIKRKWDLETNEKAA